MAKKWTIPRARACISLLHPIAFANGYNLHLGGGVLVKGQSKNDLDVLAVRRPQTLEVDTEMLFKQLYLMGFRSIKQSHYPYRWVLKFEGMIWPWRRLKVDLIIMSLLNDPPQTEPVYHPVLSQEQWDAKHWKELTESHDYFLKKLRKVRPAFATL